MLHLRTYSRMNVKSYISKSQFVFNHSRTYIDHLIHRSRMNTRRDRSVSHNASFTPLFVWHPPAIRCRWRTGSAWTLLQIYLVPAQSKLLTIKAGAGIGHTIGGPVWTCARLRARRRYVRTRGTLLDHRLGLHYLPIHNHQSYDITKIEQLMKWAEAYGWSSTFCP